MNSDRQAWVANQLAGFVRPLMVENDDSTYAYTIGATCFFVTIRDAIFMVTTLHGVGNWDAEDLFVSPAPGSRTAVPFSSIHKAHTPDIDKEDPDYADFLFARVNLDVMEIAERPLLRAYPDSASLAPDVLYRSGNEYVFCGFPFEKSDVDYEKQKIKRVMRSGFAEYVGPFISTACHTLRFGGVNDIDDMNGFSGSPVFAVLSDNGVDAGVALAGMILRSTKESGFIHVLDWHFLYTQLLSAAEHIHQ